MNAQIEVGDLVQFKNGEYMLTIEPGVYKVTNISTRSRFTHDKIIIENNKGSFYRFRFKLVAKTSQIPDKAEAVRSIIDI